MSLKIPRTLYYRKITKQKHERKNSFNPKINISKELQKEIVAISQMKFNHPKATNQIKRICQCGCNKPLRRTRGHKAANYLQGHHKRVKKLEAVY